MAALIADGVLGSRARPLSTTIMGMVPGLTRLPEPERRLIRALMPVVAIGAEMLVETGAVVTIRASDPRFF